MSSTPLIPGLSMLGFGYDVFASPYCVDTERKGTAGEPLVSGLTPSDAHEVTALGRTYLCPSVVQIFDEQATGKSQTLYGSSVQDYFRQLALTANIGAGIGAFTGSVDAFFGKSSHNYTEYIYGEHSYTVKGLVIELPEPAALRARVPEHVRSVLLGPPENVIARFGTHLVGGVVIGGKAVMRQYSLRRDVANESEWQLALEASYTGVTTSTSVESKYTLYVSTFKGELKAQTVGGKSMLIDSRDAFATWASTITHSPAVIDFTRRMVPLWQLLDPVSDASARSMPHHAVVDYARRFQPGTLYGGFQGLTSKDSSRPRQRGLEWGHPDDGAVQEIGGAKAWSPVYGWGNSFITLRLSTGKELQSTPNLRGMVVYGGRQRASNDAMNDPAVDVWSWGIRTHPLTNEPLQEQRIATGRSWTQQYGWGNSEITLFVGPLDNRADNGWVVVGGEQIVSNHSQSKPWIPTSSWGARLGGGVAGQQIGMVEAWSQAYGWGASQIKLHLRALLSDSDVP